MKRSITKRIKDMDILIGKNIINGKKPSEYLNHTQLQILMYLTKHRDEEVCQKDLEIETHLKKASITGTLDSMEDKGIIKRIQSTEDRRKNLIVLSEKAIIEKERFEEKFKQIEERIKHNITDEELENFYSVLDKMERNLK